MNIVLYALCLLIPYGFLFSWPPVVSVYASTMRVLLPVACGCALLVAWKGGKIDRAAFAGLVYALGGIAISSLLLRSLGFSEVLRILVIVAVMAYVAQSGLKLQVVARIVAITAILEIAFVLYEPLWANGPDGWKGSFGSSNLIGGFGIIVLPFALYLWFTEKHWPWAWLGMAAYAVGVAYIFQGHCRAGIGLWPVISGAMAWFYGTKRKTWGVIAAFVLLGAIFIPLNVQHVQNVPNLSGASVYGRGGAEAEDGQWCSQKMIKDNFFVGVGIGNWRKAAIAMGLKDKATGHSYNEVGTIAGEMGLFGLAAFGLMVGWVLWAARTRPVLCVVIASMLAHSLVFGLRTAIQSFYFAIFAGLALQGNKNDRLY